MSNVEIGAVAGLAQDMDVRFETVLQDAAIPDSEPLEALFGRTVAEALIASNRLKTTAANTSRLMELRLSMAQEHLDDLAAIAHLENVRGLISTAEQVHEARALDAERNGVPFFEELAGDDDIDQEQYENYQIVNPKRQAKRANYAEHIQNLRDLGWSVSDIRAQLEHRKIWETFTPHPTSDKSKLGQKVWGKAAEGMCDEDGFKLALSGPLTPRLKYNLQDETQEGLNHAETYLDGVLDYLQDMQWALDNVLEEESFDLRDTAIDLALRDWYAGDADGKLVQPENLFSKRLQGAVRGAQKYIEILNAVPENQREPLQSAIDTFTELHTGLKDIETDSKALAGGNLASAIEQFNHVFAKLEFEGVAYNQGPALTNVVMKSLRKISDNPDQEASVRSAAERATLMHKQVGIALGRQEIRHSGDDYNQIFDNLFTYLANQPEIAQELGLKKGATLSDIGKNSGDVSPQIQFYTRLMERYGKDDAGRAQLMEWIETANKGKLEGPAAQVIDRFKVVQSTFNHNRMGAAIIAEAGPMSCIQQQILAEICGIKGMAHTALNESQETIRDAGKNLRLYLQTFGHKNLKIRQETIEATKDHPEVFVCIMDPASDSHKSWGMSMKGLQIKSWGAVTKLSQEFGTAALMKIGTGLSYARGGFPPEMVPRLHLHVMSSVMDLPGMGEETRKLMKRQMSMVSTTIQGRGPGMLRGSPDQVQDAIAKIGFEIDAACLAIDGKIAPKDVAPLAVKYSPAMRRFIDEAEQEERDHYHDIIRFGRSDEEIGEHIENRHMKATSATHMALLTNVSARKASRDDGDSKVEVLKDKPVGGQRAIGQTIIKEWSESKYDGWPGLGTFLNKTAAAMRDKKISRKDVTDLASDEIFTRHKWGNAILSLAGSDLEWGFDAYALEKTGDMPEERWTVARVLQVQENGYQGLDEIETRQAEIAYAALLASAQLEALFNTAQNTRVARAFKDIFSDAGKEKDMRLSDHDLIKSLYDPNDTLERVKFGPKTLARYPDIESTQALAIKDKLMRAMVHEGEARIRARSEALEEGSADIQKYRHIAMTRRSFGPLSLPTLMDKPNVTFGAKPEGVMAFVGAKAEIAQQAADMEHLQQEGNMLGAVATGMAYMR